MESFKVCLVFPQRWFCIRGLSLAFLESFNNLAQLRRSNLHFLQTLREIYHKLQYNNKSFEKYHGLFYFPWKVAFYLLPKCGIVQPCTSIKCFSRFKLGFWQTSTKIYKKHWYEKKVFGKFVLLFQFCILWQNFVFLSLSPIFNHPEDSFRLLNKIISIPIWQKKIGKF